MIKLIKIDFLRILKDKLFLIVCILSAVFAIITPLLNYGIITLMADVMDATDEEAALMMGMMQIDAKTMFFSAFSAGNNFGMILPILFSIVLCKDFSQGTVRNKILSGRSRREIYLSSFIVTSAVLIASILVHAVMTLGFSLLLMDYQSEPFSASDFGYAIASVGLWVLAYIAISALVTYLCHAVKNAGVSVVLFFAINLVFTLVGTLLIMGGGMLVDNPDLTTALINIADAIPFSATHGLGTEYTAAQVLTTVIASVLLTAIFTLLGMLSFNKKDLK